MVRIRKEKILLSPDDIKPSSKELEILGVLNPGALRLKDKRILLYVRVIEKLKKTEDSRYYYSPRFVGKEEFKIKIDKFNKNSVVGWDGAGFRFKDGTKRLVYLSHLRRVFLDKEGFNILKIDKKPSFYGTKNDAELGVEDPRITKIDENYYMTYVGLGIDENISTNLAVSADGIDWHRKGIIFGEQDKDTVLFPEKVNGKYVAFDRPEGSFEFTPPHMWIAFSKDIQYWGKLQPLILKDYAPFNRSGAGPPPIKTNKGWLLIFHGVTRRKHKKFLYSIRKFFGFKNDEELGYSSEDIYAVWAALFDINNPRKLIAISSSPIIIPKGKYNVSFEGKNVIFPTGIIGDLDRKNILLYSGIGDIYVGVNKINLNDILNTLRKV